MKSITFRCPEPMKPWLCGYETMTHIIQFRKAIAIMQKYLQPNINEKFLFFFTYSEGHYRNLIHKYLANFLMHPFTLQTLRYTSPPEVDPKMTCLLILLLTRLFKTKITYSKTEWHFSSCCVCVGGGGGEWTAF